MKKALKSVLALTLVLAMTLSFATVSVNAYTTDADGRIEYSITLNDVSTDNADGTKVDVPIVVNNGLGIAGLVFNIEFDSQYLDFSQTMLKYPFTPNSTDAITSSPTVNVVDGSGAMKIIKIVMNEASGLPLAKDLENYVVGTLTFTVKGSPAAGTKTSVNFIAEGSTIGAAKAEEALDLVNYVETNGKAPAAKDIVPLVAKNATITLGDAPVTGDKTLLTTALDAKEVPYNTGYNQTGAELNTALGLPSMVEFDVEGDETVNVEVDWACTTTYDGRGPATYTFEGTPKNLPSGYVAGDAKATIDITVKKGTISEAVAIPVNAAFNTAIADLEIPTGGAYAKATELGDELIWVGVGNFDTEKYAPTTVGKQTFYGEFESANFDNPSSVQAVLEITVAQADLGADWDYTYVTDQTFVESLTQTVPVGTELAASGLPTTIPVKINGAVDYTANLPITWSDYDSSTAGAKTVNGTIGGTTEVAAPQKNTITANVTFEAATEKVTIAADPVVTYPGDDFIVPISMLNPDAISGGVRGTNFTIAYGTNDHEAIKGVRIGDSGEFEPLAVGTPATVGNFVLNVEAAGTINVAWTDPSGVAYTEDTELFELQFTAKADYNDPTPSTAQITIPSATLSGADGTPVNDFVASNATVTILPLQVAFVKDDSFTLNVDAGTDSDALAAKLAESFATVEVELGAVTAQDTQNPGFGDASIAADPSFRKTASYNVQWNVSTFEPASTDPQTITGTIQIPADGQGVANAASLAAEVTVQVSGKTVTAIEGSPFAISTRHEDITEVDAIAKYLPTTVTVTLSDGSSQANVPITWTRTDGAGWDASGSNDVTYTFEGTLDLSGVSGITNPDDVKATATLTFTNKHVLSEVTDILNYLVELPVPRLDSEDPAYDADYADWVDVNNSDSIDIGDAVLIVDIILGYE